MAPVKAKSKCSKRPTRKPRKENPKQPIMQGIDRERKRKVRCRSQSSEVISSIESLDGEREPNIHLYFENIKVVTLYSQRSSRPSPSNVNTTVTGSGESVTQLHGPVGTRRKSRTGIDNSHNSIAHRTRASVSTATLRGFFTQDTILQPCALESDSDDEDIPVPGSVIKSNPRRDLIPESSPLSSPSIAAHFSDHGLINHFNSNADRVSEAALIKAVENLNYAISTCISNASDRVVSRLGRFKDAKGPHVPFAPPPAGHMRRVQQMMIDTPPEDTNARNLALEILLHDRLCSILYDKFFEGELFAGIDQRDRDCLERLFLKVRDNKSWREFQRCRSILAEAAFAVSELRNVDLLTAELLNTVEQIFICAYFRKSLRFRTNIINPAIHDERGALKDIVQRACDLSLSMQRDLVSCWGKVTIAPTNPSTKNFRPFDSRCVDPIWKNMGAHDGDEVLGTFKFGLEQIDEYGERKCFIRPEVITESLLHNIDQM